MNATLTIGALAVLTASTPAQAGGTWTELSPANDPDQRYNHSLTPMPGSTTGELVLFGGRRFNAAGGTYLGDTWKWDGTDWTDLMLSTPAPSAREDHAAGHDPVRDRLVIFSGWNGGSYLSDTWEFDGNAWTNVVPQTTTPPKRDWATLTYDPNTSSMILFGGHDYNDFLATPPLGAKPDMWSWDGLDWSQLSPPTMPPARGLHVMATFDFGPTNRGLLLFGGTNQTAFGGALADTWSWNGTTWTQHFPANSPTTRNDAVMEWDPVRQVVVLHGGSTGSGTNPCLNETWEWNGLDWTQVSTAGPRIANTGLAWDGNQFVLFGGALVTNKSQTDDKTYTFDSPLIWQDLGSGLAGGLGEPMLTGSGIATASSSVTYTTVNAAPSAPGFLVASLSAINLPIFGGTLVPAPSAILNYNADGSGTAQFTHGFGPTTPPGVPIYLQAWFIDGTGPQGFTASNGLLGTTQ